MLLYKNSFSWKTDSQLRVREERGLRENEIPLKIFSENRLSGKSNFYTVAPQAGREEARASPVVRTFFGPLLLLLVGLLLDGAEQGEDDACLRVDADGRDDDLAAALHDVRAGEHHGVAVGALLHLVRLAG